jgi:hypothetical protein
MAWHNEPCKSIPAPAPITARPSMVFHVSRGVLVVTEQIAKGGDVDA